MPKPGLVIFCVERPRPVEIDPGAGVDATHRHQLERGRLSRLAPFEGVVQCPGYEGADAYAVGFGSATHLFGKLVVKVNRSSHDAIA